MSNIIYEDKMFNEEIKNEFISQYAHTTQKTLSRMFKVTQATESNLGKDLFDFSRDQLRRVLFTFRPTTEYSSKHNVSWLSRYLDYCIERGYTKGINPLDSVSAEWKIQFVNNKIKKYWTAEELDDITNKCKNSQDRIIIELLRAGAFGKGYCELLNLQIHDVDRLNNTLTLTNEEGNKRTITVSTNCINECIRASLDLEYEKMNGEPNPNRKSDIGVLVDNSYIVKSVRTNTEHFDESERNVVNRRLTKIAATINEPYFIPKNISYSSMIELGKDLFLSRGKLQDEEYELICKQFNIPEQSMYRMKSEIISISMIKELYQI